VQALADDLEGGGAAGTHDHEIPALERRPIDLDVALLPREVEGPSCGIGRRHADQICDRRLFFFEHLEHFLPDLPRHPEEHESSRRSAA
jgi:hypothetical protein